MKQKKQTEKKLSLKKLQMVKINNPKTIMGGGCSVTRQTTIELLEDNDGEHTGTRPTK